MNANELKARFPNASQEFIAANVKQSVAPVEAIRHAAEQCRDIEERDLQSDCEQWLRNRGYMPMTKDSAEIESEKPMRKGWYAHLHEPRGNPLMPDLMIYSADMRRCLMVELKVRNKYQPGQKEMIGLGAWKEARTFQVVTELVTEFEKECEK